MAPHDGSRAPFYPEGVDGGTTPGWQPHDARGTLPTRPGAAPYRQRDINGVTGIRLHYTAGGTWSTVRDIAAYQTGPTAQDNFPAIAYHVLVDGDGVAHWCHDLDVRVWGSGQSGSNERDVHICYTGSVEPTLAQLVGLRRAVAWAQVHIGRALSVRGHSDGFSTQCPGPRWPEWRDAVAKP